MSAVVSDCCSPCPVLPPVNVPGPQGTAGINGLPAYTTVGTGGFTVPAINSTVNIPVVTSAWAFVGDAVAVQNATATADTYVVTAVPDSTHITLKYLNYPTNTNAGSNIPAGNLVTPTGFQLSFTPLNPANNLSDLSNVASALANLGLGVAPVTTYVVGGSTSLTNTPAQILGAGITLSAGAKYLMLATGLFNYVGATYAGNQTLTFKLRRTNNTATDLPNAVTTYQMEVLTTITKSMQYIPMPPTYYTAVGADIIQPFASVSATPSAGSIQAIECSIVAVRLS